MTMQSYYQNYINGQFVDGGAGRLEVDDPAEGEERASDHDWRTDCRSLRLRLPRSHRELVLHWRAVPHTHLRSHGAPIPTTPPW